MAGIKPETVQEAPCPAQTPIDDFQIGVEPGIREGVFFSLPGSGVVC